MRNALNAAEIKQLNDKPQDFSLAVFEEGSKSWGVQTRGQAGYRAPQDPNDDAAQQGAILQASGGKAAGHTGVAGVREE